MKLEIRRRRRTQERLPAATSADTPPSLVRGRPHLSRPPTARFHIGRWPLRARLTLLLLVSALVPLLTVGGLAVVAVRRDVNTSYGVAALGDQARQGFLTAVENAAGREGARLSHIQAETEAVATSARFLFDHPDLFPGVQQGNSELQAHSNGEFVSARGAPVGVFVPSGAPTGTPALWQEVALLSHLDPFLQVLYASHGTTPVLRFWVMTPDGMVRAVPNPEYGHAGSPVQAGALLTADPYFQLATPKRDPTWAPVWTPYVDLPGVSTPVTILSIPVYDQTGTFRAVVGADVPQALGTSLPYPVVGFFSQDAGWIAGTSAGKKFFAAGQALWAVHEAAAHAPTLSTLQTSRGPDLLAVAPLPTSHWFLAVAVPEGQVLGPVASVVAAAHAAQRQIEVVVAVACLILVALLAWAARAMAARTTQPIERLAARMRRTGAAADDGTPLPAAPEDEADLLAREFDALEARLGEAARRLEAEVLARARAEREGELRILAERNALAREVHDSLAQGFVAALMLAESGLTEATAGDWDAAQQRMQRLVGVARDGLARARSSVRALLPPPNLRSGLERELARLQGDLDVRLEVGGDASALPPPVRGALLGVAREALANVRRHADARSVAVRLCCAPEYVRMEIVDDGRGFDPRAVGEPGEDLRGFGLDSMRSRATEVAGTVDVEAVVGTGTTARVHVPLAPAAAPAPAAETAALCMNADGDDGR